MTLHIVLCASIRSQLKKLLKFASKWERNNEMKFGIDKCEKLITWGEVSKLFNKSNPSFIFFKTWITENELLYLLRYIIFKWFRIETDHTESE